MKAFFLWLARVPPEPLDPMGDVQSLRVFRAAPGYLRYITFGWIVSQASLWLVAIVALTAVVSATGAAGRLALAAMGLGVVAVLLLLSQAIVTYFWLRLNYELRWYKVTDRSLRIRSGVWSVHEMTMTFANVQNITITQGPLERLFGVSNVKVDTAGGGGSGGHGGGEGLGGSLHVGVFRGVDNPDETRNLMLDRLRRMRDTGLGDLDESRDLEAARARRAELGASAELLRVLAAFRDEAKALRRVADAGPSLTAHAGERGTVPGMPAGASHRR